MKKKTKILDYGTFDEIVRATRQEALKEVLAKLLLIRNQYPSDIFRWDNIEKLNFNRGRFNRHCFEIWQNCMCEVVEVLEKQIKDGEK